MAIPYSIPRRRYKTWLVLGLLLLLSAPLPSPAQVDSAIILMYHRFGEDRYPSTSVTLEQFEAHLAYLEQSDHRVWPLARVVEHIRRDKPLPGDVVVITVDDAYASVYEQAFPRLKKRGWPFTVFVASDPVDKGLGGYMSWEQMREMRDHGVTFANHSDSHGHLIERREGESESQWRQRVRGDIQRAARRLKQELGEAPRLFAYPYGEYDESLAALIRDMGYVAFGQQSGGVHSGSDPRVLPRFPMAVPFAALDKFKSKVNTLAMPVTDVSPWDPVVPGIGSPALTVTVDAADLRPGQLRCYASGQGQAQVRWLDREAGRFEVRAEEPLSGRRSRYNCTAPSKTTGRYYWFSHLWIDPRRPEG